MISEKYLKTNIDGFDELLGKGIPQGSSVLVEGGPGSGKTMFCLTMVNNFCLQGLKCLYMSFEEPKDKLIQHMHGFGWNTVQLMAKGQLRIERYSALDIARSVEALLTEAKRELLIDVDPILIPKDFAPNIVIFDSLSAISSAFSGEKYRFRIYMEQLFRYLEKSNTTSFLIRETPRPAHTGLPLNIEDEAVSFLSDGIISIYRVLTENGERGRAIEIIKMRGTTTENKIVELNISEKNGITINHNKTINQNNTLT